LGHPFGTDDLGPDLLARILYRRLSSMAVSLATMLIAILLGMVIGTVTDFCEGVLDTALMRLTDLFFPGLVIFLP
jgi:peptide/nickel transport system permease protein